MRKRAMVMNLQQKGVAGPMSLHCPAENGEHHHDVLSSGIGLPI